MYNDTARALAVRVIGTVESRLNYTAVNYNDPITIGIAQWYGTRAANVLCRMRDENPGSWYGVEASLTNDLANIPKSDSYWNMRYLNQFEGSSLAGVMSRNEAIQNAQLGDDLEPYKQTAIEYGFNPDTNTKTVIYFFCMHHQSPKSALEVVLTLDTEATLDQIHAATLNHQVLGQYSNRYNESFTMIRDADLTAEPDVPTDPGTPPPTDPAGDHILHATFSGEVLQLRYPGKTEQLYPNGRDYWIPRKKYVAPPPPDPVDPPIDPPPGGDTGEWTHPLPGSAITSPYGPRGFDGVGDFHYGTDFSTGGGAPVLAPTALRITVAMEDGAGGSWSAGSYVKGHTLDGAYTINFYHMIAGSINVSPGQEIPKGHRLGNEGNTGNSFGAHLHFEMYEGMHDDPWPPPYGIVVNPEPILRAKGVNI